MDLEQRASCVVQRQGGLIVADPSSDCIQVFHGDAGFEILTGVGQRFQFLVGGHHVLEAVALALLSLAR